MQTWLVKTILIGIVVLSAFGIFVGEVGAQEESDLNTTADEEGNLQKSGVNLIARSDSTVKVGETVTLGFPKEDFPSDGDHEWEIIEGPAGGGELLHTGAEGDNADVTKTPQKIPPHNGRVTSFRALEPTQREPYKIRGTVDGQSYTTEIEVESEQVSGVNKMDLLEKHAPVLNFHPEENYRPTRIEALFENSYLCEVREKEDPDPKKDRTITVREIVSESPTVYDLSTGRETEEMYLQQYPLADQVLPDGDPTLNGDPACSTDNLPQGFTRQGDLLEDYDPQNSPYPETVYASVVKDGVSKEGVRFNPSDTSSDPNHKDEYENALFEPPSDIQGGDYTALAYWMVYVHDPKPSDERSFDPFNSPLRDINFQALAGHTGDIEPIFILLNDDNEPEWVLAQQHKGGEYRKWENVEKEGGNPVIYPADGAHSNFFGTRGGDLPETTARGLDDGQEPEYIYQAQYIKDDAQGTYLAEYIPILGSNSIGVNILYTDLIGDQGLGVGDILRPADYDIAVLTGEEAWSDYQGDLYRYSYPSLPGIPDSDGSIPQIDDRFDNPGEWGMNNLHADVAKTSTEGSLGTIPEIAQIDGKLSDPEEDTFKVVSGSNRLSGDPSDLESIREDIVTPDGRSLCSREVERVDDATACFEYEAPPPVVTENDPITPEEADGSVGVNVINTGMQPHEFTDDLPPQVGGVRLRHRLLYIRSS